MAETQAQDLILTALMEIGVYGTSETLKSGDASLGLTVLNDMMDQWSNEDLACFAILEQSAPLVPGQASYTIGPGGNFNMTRPLDILTGYGTAYSQDPNGNNYLMEVVQRDRWNLLSNRSDIVNSNFPAVLFYDPQFPLGVINIVPFPNIAYQMFWDSRLQLQEFPNLTTAITLPPGYNAAIRHNLAAELWPFFGPTGVQLDPVVASLAQVTKGNIKRTNMKPAEAIFDPEIISRGSLSYNPYTDSPGSVVQSV